MEWLILVSLVAGKLVLRSEYVESGGSSDGTPICKRFLGSQDRESRSRMRSRFENLGFDYSGTS